MTDQPKQFVREIDCANGVITIRSSVWAAASPPTSNDLEERASMSLEVWYDDLTGERVSQSVVLGWRNARELLRAVVEAMGFTASGGSD